MKALTKRLSLYFITICFFVSPAWAMESANYKIEWDSVNVGGSDDGQSETYRLQDTIGEIASGPSSSDDFLLSAGYRQADSVATTSNVLSFSVASQLTSSEVAATVFNLGANTVTVADATGFVVDDFIVVVMNKGAAQAVAVGEIESIAGNEITVDGWQGEDLTAVNGTDDDDYVYELSSSGLELGELDEARVNTAVTFSNVSTNSASGYTVTLSENQDLQKDASNKLADSDGVVSAGTAEYGVELVGDDVPGPFLNTDTAISGTKEIATNGTSSNTNKRTAVIYKASISSSTTAGTYSQTLSYSCTANF